LRIFQGIHQIREPYYDRVYKLGLGLYLLTDGEAALVDSGIAVSPSNCIFPYLKEVNLLSILMVINTHGHEDHVGGNWELKERFGSRIAVHSLDAPWAEDPDLYFREFYAQYPQYIPPTEEVRSTIYSERGRGCGVDIRLEDGAVMEAGGRKLQVIYTPGHSPGSICLYDRVNRILFSGDAIQGRGINTPAYPDIPMYMDLPAYVEALQRISRMPIDLMLTAHEFKPFESMVLKGTEVKAFISESLRIVDEMEANILRLVKGPREPLDLLDLTKAIREAFAGPGVSTQALGTVDAHLRKLSDEGKVELTEKEGRRKVRLL